MAKQAFIVAKANLYTPKVSILKTENSVSPIAAGGCCGTPAPKEVNASGCCGGPALRDTNACCVADETAKEQGGNGCGC